jgi:X-Pro dipeptidyl-peptidase
MTPGAYARIAWETLPQEYVFRKGHRLALVIAGTDATYSDEAATGANVTVDLAASRVLVPLTLSTLSARDVPSDAARWRGPALVDLPEPENLFY